MGTPRAGAPETVVAGRCPEAIFFVGAGAFVLFSSEKTKEKFPLQIQSARAVCAGF
jgi:hypothetical protein